MSGGNEGETWIDANQQSQLATLADRVKTLNEILTGNGKPAEGLVAQMLLLRKDLEYTRAEGGRDTASVRSEIAALRVEMQQNQLKRDQELTQLRAELQADRHKREQREAERIRQRAQDWRSVVFPLVQYLLIAVVGGMIALVLQSNRLPLIP